MRPTYPTVNYPVSTLEALTPKSYSPGTTLCASGVNGRMTKDQNHEGAQITRKPLVPEMRGTQKLWEVKLAYSNHRMPEEQVPKKIGWSLDGTGL